MPADSHAMQRMLAEMRSEYRRALPDKLAEIQTLWREIAASPEPASRARELRRLAHTLAGTAGSFGLSAVTDAARALEEELESLCRPEARLSDEISRRIDSCVDALGCSAAE